MTNATRERALAYLSECAERIAPVWEPHIASRVPPQEVVAYFDASVENLIAAEPELLTAFGYGESQRSQLVSDLLDVVIDRARQEVGRIRQRKAAEARAKGASTATETVREDPELGDGKGLTTQERLAYLRAKRDLRLAEAKAQREAELEAEAQREAELEAEAQARREAEEQARREVQLARERVKREEARIAAEAQARREAEAQVARKEAEERARQEAEERARREAEAQARREAQRLAEEKAAAPIRALLRDSLLVDTSGALKHSEMNAISERFAALIAANWSPHGGQQLGAELTSFFDYFTKALLHGADPSDGTWDVQMKDGSIHRYSSSADLSSSYSHIIGQLVLSAAKPHFTYEQTRSWSKDDLMTLALAAVTHRVELVSETAAAEAKLAAATESLSAWQDLHPAPPACPYGVSPEGAETWCRDWLLHMGMADAEVTQLVGDGGVDVVSARHVVQVKHYTGAVSIAEMRELVGVAAVEGKKPVFMTSGSYPAQGESFADKAGMLLFRYDVTTAAVEGWTAESRLMIRSGFLEE